MKHWLYIALCVGFLSSLVACGSSNQVSEQPNEPNATSEVVASTLPPHMATIKGDVFEGEVPVTMKVGEFYVFTGESKGWIVETQNPELVKVEQGGTKDTYETNPGFQAIGQGRAVVTVTSPNNTILTIMVTIEK
jgi:hypothetical protein